MYEPWFPHPQKGNRNGNPSLPSALRTKRLKREHVLQSSGAVNAWDPGARLKFTWRKEATLVVLGLGAVQGYK